MWGNRGGGGGDPLRDDAGNVISDLNKVRHYTHTNRPGGAGKRAGAPPPPEEAGGSYDYGDDPLYPPAPSQAGGVAMLMPPGGHTVYVSCSFPSVYSFRSDSSLLGPGIYLSQQQQHNAQGLLYLSAAPGHSCAAHRKFPE